MIKKIKQHLTFCNAKQVDRSATIIFTYVRNYSVVDYM